MKVLVVEDDPNKMDQILAFIKERFINIDCRVARSYSSALEALISDAFNVAILDMQLPTFDKSPSEDGGRRRSLAGRDLLKQLLRRKISTGAIIVTQFQEFGEEGQTLSLEELQTQLARMKISNYKGFVYYHPKLSNWKGELEAAINKAAPQAK